MGRGQPRKRGEKQRHRETNTERQTDKPTDRDTERSREDVPLVQFMYLVFIRMPGESYRRRLRSLLLCLCDVFQVLINSLVF